MILGRSELARSLTKIDCCLLSGPAIQNIHHEPSPTEALDSDTQVRVLDQAGSACLSFNRIFNRIEDDGVSQVLQEEICLRKTAEVRCIRVRSGVLGLGFI